MYDDLDPFAEPTAEQIAETEALAAEIIGQLEADVQAGNLTEAELDELVAAGWTASDELVSRMIARHEADQAQAAETASLAAYYGAEPVELTGYGGEPVELAFSRETARVAEDQAEFGGGRRGSAEQRLASALDRIGRGTYVPPQAPAGVQLASGTDHGRALAAMRWNRQPDESAAVRFGAICGAPDPLGRCAEPYHSRDCSSLADMGLIDSPQLRQVMAARVHQPWITGGRTWSDQYGSPMDLTGLIEAATGERLGDPAWSDRAEVGLQSRETLQPRRAARFADLDDDGDPGFAVPPGTRAAVAQAKWADGSLQGRTAADARTTGEQRRGDAIYTGRVGAADTGQAFDMGSRRAAVRSRGGRVVPVPLAEPDDGLAGALPQYAAGMI